MAVADDDDAPAPVVQCTVTPPPAAMVATVRGYYEGNRHRADRDHGENWLRVLIAFGAETHATLTPYTAAEARQGEQVWNGWTPVRKELERLEAAAAQCSADDGAPEDTAEPEDTVAPEISIAAGAGVTEGTAATFTVTATPAPAADLTVAVTVAEASGSDFVAADDEGAQSVTVPAGQTSVALAVTTVDDGTDEPDGQVSATLASGTGYTVSTTAGAATVAVTDNDASGALSMSIHDAEGPEGSKIAFRVMLSSPAPDRVQAFWITSRKGGTATEGVDYAFGVGRVAFAAGESEKTVHVQTFDDAHNDPGETFRVKLLSPHNAVIADGEAIGTILNDDPMPAAWLARFGRTVAEQALGGIADRMAADRAPGMRGSLGGRSIAFDPWQSGDTPAGRDAAPDASMNRDAAPALADLARTFGAAQDRFDGGAGHRIGDGQGVTSMQSMTARELLLGSSFSLTGRKDGSGGSMAFWGRAAQGSFAGAEDDLSLDGEVTTGMLGADYARGRWLVGLALTQSEGKGDYRDPTPPPPLSGQPDSMSGKIESSLTAVIPYASLRASDRLKLWGAAGYGSGEVTLTTDPGSGSGAGGGETLKADTGWTMAAAGARGDLLTPPEDAAGGPALAVVSDAMWARTTSDRVAGMAASESDVTRLRLGLEGSWRVALDEGGSLTPKLEIGARHDGGDAETGFGVELGGGIAWTDPALGLSLDLSGRTLVAHEDGDLKDRGVSAAPAFHPAPATQRGLSLSLRQEMGGQAQGGLDALFANDPLEDRTGSEAQSRWSAEAAYGLPAFGGRFTGSPHVGFGLATGARDYSLGWRLAPEAANAPDLSFGLKATRRESDSAAPEHTIGFEATARW
ncbi:MAG: autotransporter outer membrane beta-barrel domain-containing protein [Rhodospirillales bacterium]|nr:autotransporter outer membrane beta-barrel domain-containing protein [Rhodospirillales bacterium]